MRNGWYLLLLMLYACGNVGREPSIMASPDSLPPIIDADTLLPVSKEDTTITLQTPPVKKPYGTYRFYSTIDSMRMEHTIKFLTNQTYRLEEKYHNDSIVSTTGTWAISNGSIWTYRQQLLRGRYQWKNNVLQYTSPEKSYPLTRIPEITENKVWTEKRKQGISFFGIGNEPFWNIEIGPSDSIQFRMAEWNKPVKFRITGKTNTSDSVFFSGATKDSILITLTILPYFCNDGMSDFIYPKKIRVNYNQQEFSGCGMLYK